MSRVVATVTLAEDLGGRVGAGAPAGGEGRSMQDRPLISIGLPVYNGEAYLEEALRSFLDQTVDDLEIVVSDDASTDRTAEISQDLATKDGRIRYLLAVERWAAATTSIGSSL